LQHRNNGGRCEIVRSTAGAIIHKKKIHFDVSFLIVNQVVRFRLVVSREKKLLFYDVKIILKTSSKKNT
jgi:hypothetical protein